MLNTNSQPQKWSLNVLQKCRSVSDPPTYAESSTGAVDIRDEDDDEPGTMGDVTFTPMYTYVYDYRYRPPPAYSEVCQWFIS